MRGAIFVNAYFLGDSAAHQLQRMTDALQARGAEVDVFRSDCLPVCVDGQMRSTIGERDFIVYLDKDPHLSYSLEKAGYRLYNSARAIEVCDDKMRTCIALCGEVPMPKTVSSPLMYRETSETEFAKKVGKLLGYPVVVKLSFGSMGYGVRLAKNREELQEIRDEWKLQPHLYQAYVAESAGIDLRVIVVGGKVLGAIERRNEGDFRSNVEQGGRAQAVQPDSRAAGIATRVAEVLQLDYCGVDLLKTKDGYVVCEVNSNAYFRAFEKATGVDVAGAYADHVLATCKNLG